MDVANFKINSPNTRTAQEGDVENDPDLEGNAGLRIGRFSRHSLKMPPKNTVDNFGDGINKSFEDSLKADAKRQKDEVVNYHLQVVQQKLDMSKKNLADLYPEEQYLQSNAEYLLPTGQPNQPNFSKRGDQRSKSEKRSYISPFRPNLKMYFPKQDQPVLPSDGTKI